MDPYQGSPIADPIDVSKVEPPAQESFCIVESAVQGVAVDQSFAASSAAEAGVGAKQAGADVRATGAPQGMAVPEAPPSATAVQCGPDVQDAGVPMDSDMNTEIKTEVGSYATVPPSVMASSASNAGGLGGGLRPCGPGQRGCVCNTTYDPSRRRQVKGAL